MATATKSARSKAPKIKKAVVAQTEPEELANEGDVVPAKIKKPLEIDEPEATISIEEKTEEDPLLGAVEEEDSAEEVGLDGEELNPFGDRWEE